MLKIVIAAGALIVLPTAAFAEVAPEAVTRIQAMLKDMQCEVAPENIEADGDAYELDDVFCADGQYDIDLDKDLQVTNKKKE